MTGNGAQCPTHSDAVDPKLLEMSEKGTSSPSKKNHAAKIRGPEGMIGQPSSRPKPDTQKEQYPGNDTKQNNMIGNKTSSKDRNAMQGSSQHCLITDLILKLFFLLHSLRFHALAQLSDQHPS